MTLPDEMHGIAAASGGRSMTRVAFACAVVGMLLDVARSLGSGIDVQASEQRAPLPLINSAKALPGGRR